MNYFFRDFIYKQKKVRVLAQTCHNFFLFVNIKRSLFLYVMNARTRFANPCVHAKYFSVFLGLTVCMCSHFVISPFLLYLEFTFT